MTEHRSEEARPLRGTVRLSAEGIAKVLGDLEARLMHALWSLGRPVPARVVHAHVINDHPVALHTVITVLNKLVGKGLLRRQKNDGLLHYEAVVSEEEFRTRASRSVVEGILSLGTEAVVASFVDVLADRNPEQLTELMRLVEARLREEETGE